MLSRLTMQDKEALECFYRALLKGETSIELPFEASIDRIMFLYKMIFSFHPEFVHVDNSHISVRAGFGKSVVKIRKNTKWNVIKGTHTEFSLEQARYLKELARDTVKKLGIENKSDMAKAVGIFDYLVTTVKYHEADCAHNAWGALVDKKAVCEGIAYAYCLLARAARLEAIKVSGTLQQESHAWNMVKIDGKTYHLDATADLQESRYNDSYDHLFLCDSDMKDYLWDRNLYVPCTSVKHNYFIYTDSFAVSRADAERIMKRQIDRNKTVYLRFDRGVKTDPQEISDLFRDIVSENLSCSVSWRTFFNPSMNIARIEYDKN